ncbi:MAG: hypothetical protein LC792_14190 [Actinobacteria bacterium]|nr:hypothetical protein [Actinomycetota bacterium]
MMRHRLAAAAAGAVLLLVASGCGGGSGSSSPSTSAVDDQTLANGANLRLSDLPAEWKSSPLAAGSQAASEESDRAFADCMGRPPPETIRTARADSEDFSAQETRRASSNVQVVRTVEIARDDFTALRTDKALECRKAQIDAEFRRQVPDAVPQTTIERLDLPQFGDQSVAFRVTAVGLNQGQEIRTYIDLTFVQKGRAELSAGFINRSAPFPSDLEKSLVQRMVGRA